LRAAEAALASLEATTPGSLSRVLLIYGTEAYYQGRIVRAIRKQVLDPALEGFNYTFLEHQAATCGAVRAAVLTPTMLGGQRLVVVRDPAELLSPRVGRKVQVEGEEAEATESGGGGGNESAGATESGGGAGSAEEMEAASPAVSVKDLVRNWSLLLAETPAETCLVITLSWDVPEGHALLKAAGKLDPPGDVIRCLPATPKSAETWVRKIGRELGIEFDSEASQTLVLRCGTDLGLLEGEIKKLSTYAGEKGRVTTAEVLEAATPSAEASVFELVDCIGGRRPGKAVARLRRLLEQGEVPLRLLAMVVRQVRLVFITREMLAAGARVRDIEARLGLPTFVVQSYLSQARNFDRPQLARMMRHLAEIDLAVKTGRQDAAEALELFILRQCG
jgi:DNA polymerase-3 subunit delta